MFYIYILQSIRFGRYYKGLTNNIDRRLQEHFSGNVKSTKRMLPLKLIHAEICGSRFEARKLEKYFKSGFGREIIKEIAELT